MDDDERQVEMDCISAIFPEIVIDLDNPFSASIELPVNPNSSVAVVFPASAEASIPHLPTPPRSEGSGGEQPTPHLANNAESHRLSYLPPLQLRIDLPEGYPSKCAPVFELSTMPAWLPRAYLDELQANGERMWEEGGHTEIVYGYIDSLQQAAGSAFGHLEAKVLEVPQEFKIALLDYDIEARKAAFEKETFDCGICLDPKKGSACHRMIDCGHVFCVQCLQDFYNNAITEGDLVSVRCLTPDCAKKRLGALSDKARKTKTQLSPSELLQLPLGHETVARYVKLKHKADLESDKNTIYCPRKWCQGAARSKKHRKPDGFELVESDDESDTEQADGNSFRAGNDLLSVCEDCGFAFCSRCYQGWHGEFTLCIPRTSTGELTEEDKASLEYLKLHTTPCPTCAAPCQKTHGCNHMICFKCNTHFCYLCSAWLEPENPYKHYNVSSTSCYMRLWELEGGDGDDVGIGFAGGIQEHIEEFAQDAGDDNPEDPGIPIGEAPPPPLPEDPAAPNPIAAPPLQQLQREGPLVLRINALPPVPAVPEPPQPQAAQHQRPPRRGNPNRRGGGRPLAVPPAAPRHADRRGRAVQAAAQAAAPERDAAHQEWVQRFVQMALNDEEDQLEWDSDDEDAAAWEIPVR